LNRDGEIAMQRRDASTDELATAIGRLAIATPDGARPGRIP
jgi:hypothetical protein